MKTHVLIIGAGGVARVVAHKCAQNNDVLGDIHIASRTVAKCEAIIASVREKNALEVDGKLQAHQLDAMDIAATRALIESTGAGIVINVGSPFLNMSVLSACIATGAAYIDTAIHEDPSKVCEPPPWYANYEWKRREECEKAGVTAILGAGFDPGVVNAYARFARDELFDRIETLDIIDINAGSHGRYFATNFDPEINFREFTGRVWSWQNREWTENTMFEVGKEWDLPVVGRQKAYLTGHDEVHSLSQHLGIPTVRFWMGFGDHYINVFTVLKNLGLLSEQPVTTAEGLEVVPLKVVKAVLPDPSSWRRAIPARPASATWCGAAGMGRSGRSSSTTSPTMRRLSKRSAARGSRTPRVCRPLQPPCSSRPAPGTCGRWRMWKSCRRVPSLPSLAGSACRRT